jgi:plastocyanin
MTAIRSGRIRWTSGIAIAALALAGLLGSHASAGGVARASRAETVDIANFAFNPGKVTIGAGTTVAFTNSDKTAHTATRAGSFNTGHIAPGKSVSVKFSHAGTFAYHCSIHPFMHGKIVVK